MKHQHLYTECCSKINEMDANDIHKEDIQTMDERCTYLVPYYITKKKNIFFFGPMWVHF